MSATPDTAANSRCPLCGAAFRCGVAAGDAACWCASLPPLPLPATTQPGPAPDASCLCPACLKAKLAAGDSAAHR